MSCFRTKISQKLVKKILLMLALFNILLINTDYFNLEYYKVNLPQTFKSESSDDIALAWEWYKTWGTENWEDSFGILNDSMNNIYVLGDTPYKLVLLKYNRSGYLIYNKTINIDDEADFYSADFSIDSMDNMFIVSKRFLVKVNSSGDVLWHKELRGSSFVQLEGISIDNNDSLYLTGRVQEGLILIKLTNSGEQLWNATWNDIYGECGYDMAFDGLNNIYVTGYAKGLYDWWDMQENAEILILKFNSSGNLLWNVTWRSPYYSLGCCGGLLGVYSNAYGNAITLDPNENIYITGYSHRCGVLLCYNQFNGSFWYTHINKKGAGNDIKIDNDNKIFICVDDYNSRGDFLLLKYSLNGQQLWNRTWGGSEDDSSFKMLIFSSEELFVIGITRSYTSGYRDIALVKFGIDTDNDRISDLNENTLYFTDPFDNDTDDDGVIDGLEIEIYSTNPHKIDTDDDLLSDYDEIFLYYTNPNDNETDNDLISDYDEIFLYHTNPNNNDTDNDLISDYDELFIYNTNPNKVDTDKDGFSDYDELFIHNTDPNDPFSNIFLQNLTNVLIGVIITASVILALMVFIKKRKK